ncbi:MAG: SAM-dependent methyltransferase [Muribaculaceae bacterium]|nr:SAM-dependent methyltransferase [Muribaculaceae bacterium]MDE6320749.1 SAM-dependent methyltransferase [Muribaculaceae bacterium]
MPDNNHTNITAAQLGTLYLLPSTMSDASIDRVLPPHNAEVIRSLRHFVVENVRTTRRFLKRVDRSIDIDDLTFEVLDEHTQRSDVAAMLAPLLRGESIGVISEAGCPAVADPGAAAVAEAHRMGAKVVPMVGPSSIMLSLMASGMNGQQFTFLGYLPVERQARAAALKEIQRRVSRDNVTQVFIETPYRNNRLIAELAQQLPGDMQLCVAADLTGPGESIVSRSLKEWAHAAYDYGKTPAIFVVGNNS